MKAVLFNKRNRENKLLYCDTEKPERLKDNEVLIQVYASSVNAADYRLMKMGIAPKRKIFGADISGIVASVGKNVQRFKPGDQVIGDLSNCGFGGFAEYAIAPENILAGKPPNISFEEAAALPLAGVTALQALHKADIQKGKKALIVGSSGGVGTYALQLAKYYGAAVTAVCSSRNIGQAGRLGADYIIDYTEEHFGIQKGVYDMIIAANGNYPLVTYRKCLKDGGICVFTGGALKQIFKSLLFGRLLSFGSKKLTALTAKVNHDDLNTLAELAGKGHIKPVIEKVYALEDTAEAVRHVTNGHARGKVVIKVK